MNERRANGWLNRDVLGFGLTSLFSDVSHEMSTAVLPGFLAAIGAPPAALGLIEGVADGVSSFAKLGSGWISDRLAVRKPIAVAGYVLTTAAQAVFAMALGWPQVLWGRAMGWLGRGLRGPVRDAMMAEAVEPAHYGKAFGLERSMDTVGAVIGPLLAWLLLERLGYRNLLWLTVVPGILAVASISWLTRGGRPPAPKPGKFFGQLRALPGNYRFFLGAVFLFGLGDIAHTLLILRITQIYAPSMGQIGAAGLAVLGYALHNVVNAVSSYAVGHWADRARKLPLLAAGYAVGAATFAAFLVPGAPPWFFFAMFLVSGIYQGVQEVVEKASAAEVLPSELRGLGFGALAAANGVGDLISSSAAGLIWTAFSPNAAFLYAAAFCAAGAALTFRLAVRTPA